MEVAAQANLEDFRPMQLLDRFRFSFYLTVPAAALIGLAIAVASADGVALLPPRAFDLILSPVYLLLVFSISFLIAPWVARRMRVFPTGVRQQGKERPKP
jgi:hypothetical protein